MCGSSVGRVSSCACCAMALRRRLAPHRGPPLCFWLALLAVAVTVLVTDSLFGQPSWRAPADPAPGGDSALGFLQDEPRPLSLVAPGTPRGKGRRDAAVEKPVSVAALDERGFGDDAFLRPRPAESRRPECLSQRYNASLPTATVVVCFHDEAWTTLLRTVHSVLDTAPTQYLQELLLVDDYSEHEHLKAPLSEYVSRLQGVRLLRSGRRLGVVGCRMLGAARALGDILVFLDSHCECQRGWLEPLLERIAGDRSRVVSPVLDVVHERTFLYILTQNPIRGVFDWKLNFHWEALPKQKDAAAPIRSPALGGVLAIDRQFFQRIGGYDPGMVLWGVENVELSIRVWLCGGSMEVIPCSRVGHLHHLHLSYTLPDDDIVERNKIRVVETWLDMYKNIFYKRDTVAYFIWQSESSNCTERLYLQKMLGCKNFQWYLSSVHQDLYIPQDRQGLSGELYNVGTGCCADHKKIWAPGDGAMDLSPCSGNGNQHCEMNSQKEVRWGPMGQLCFDVNGERVVLSQCPPKQQIVTRLQWNILKNGHIVHLLSKKCIEAVKTEKSPGAEKGAQNYMGKRASDTGVEGGLFLRPCSSDPRQQWHFEELIDPKRP